MTRTPRLIDVCRDRAAKLRGRLPTKFTGRSLVYLGAGLALAGTGAAAAVTLPGATGTSAGAAESLRPPTKAVAVSHRDRPAAHQARPARRPARRPVKHAETWLAIERTVAGHTVPVPRAPGRGPLPAQDRLTPTGVSGPQESMPITPARYQNAATIVRQALAKKMGLRSAVIAVATAMQESTLLNINYGTSDSLGLFQQRPSCGWGTASQILHPAYAADAFLSALRTYQANNPTWAHQPLWQPAQGVQASGFPYAYAKWEAQAAHLVGSVATRLV